MKGRRIEIDGNVTLSTKSFTELIDYINQLENDNAKMNDQLNHLAQAICEGIEKSLDSGYYTLYVDGYDVASVIHDRYEIQKQYEELRASKKKKECEVNE